MVYGLRQHSQQRRRHVLHVLHVLPDARCPRRHAAAEFFPAIRRQRHVQYRALRLRPRPQLDSLWQRHARRHQFLHHQARPHRPRVPKLPTRRRLVEHLPRDCRCEPTRRQKRRSARRRRVGGRRRLARERFQQAQGRLRDDDVPPVAQHGNPPRRRVSPDPEADRHDDPERPPLRVERRSHLQHAHGAARGRGCRRDGRDRRRREPPRREFPRLESLWRPQRRAESRRRTDDARRRRNRHDADRRLHLRRLARLADVRLRGRHFPPRGRPAGGPLQ